MENTRAESGTGVVYLGLPQVAQSEVKSTQVVEDLRGHISLHLLPEDAGGGAVGGQRSLDVGLLQDLSQLDPRLHVVWVLLCDLLQMTLRQQWVSADSGLRPVIVTEVTSGRRGRQTYFGDIPLFLIVGRCVERAQDLHGFVVVGVGLQNLFEALSCILLVSSVHIHLTQAEEGQHEGGRGKLGGLVVILEGLVVVLLREHKTADSSQTCDVAQNVTTRSSRTCT